MLQFNISKEKHKGGFWENEIDQICVVLADIHFIEVVGVMGMASDTDGGEVVRKQFQALNNIQKLFHSKYSNTKEVSMGMSSDYIIAFFNLLKMEKI